MAEKKDAITLFTDCNLCVHKGVCKYEGNAKAAKEKLQNMNYGTSSSDDYSWEDIMQNQLVDISFSCPIYRYDNGNIKNRNHLDNPM